MDDVDKLKMERALERNRSGQTSTWVNPDTHNRYAVTPTRTQYVDGEPCRDFTQDATIDGKAEQVRGTACRQSNGDWRVQ